MASARARRWPATGSEASRPAVSHRTRWPWPAGFWSSHAGRSSSRPVSDRADCEATVERLLLHVILWGPAVGAVLTILAGRGKAARVIALLSTGGALGWAVWGYGGYRPHAGGISFSSIPSF